MVSLLVVQIIKYRFGVPVVAMESRISVQSRNPIKYVTPEQYDGIIQLNQGGNYLHIVTMARLLV